MDIEAAIDLVEQAGIQVWTGASGQVRVYTASYAGHYDLVEIVNHINAGTYDAFYSGKVGKPRARERHLICEALFGAGNDRVDMSRDSIAPLRSEP